MSESHPLVKLAQETIENYVRHGVTTEPPAEMEPDLQVLAGAFVTIRRHGQLRGCIGTLEPTCDSVAEEVIRNAISAATRDPRFHPLRVDELQDLEIKVDVLSEPELVTSVGELDPKRYGLIIRSKTRPWKRGVLLPDLESIVTAEDQVYHTRHYKARITDPDEPVEMFRFEVVRYT